MDSVLLSSNKQDWKTPIQVLDPVREIAPIGLDPCSGAGSLVDAKVEIHLPEDGLSIGWVEMCPKGTLAFVNPPYGNKVSKWVKKAAIEAAYGLEVVMLIAARPDTSYWHKYIFSTAQAICFWRGRIKFVGAEHAAPFPSALVYWGPRRHMFDLSFYNKGKVVLL